jgi:hypothetical protein
MCVCDCLQCMEEKHGSDYLQCMNEELRFDFLQCMNVGVCVGVNDVDVTVYGACVKNVGETVHSAVVTIYSE